MIDAELSAAACTPTSHARQTWTLPAALLILAFGLMSLGPLRAFLASLTTSWTTRTEVVYASDATVILGWIAIIVAVVLVQRSRPARSSGVFGGLARWTMIGAVFLALASSASLAIQVDTSLSRTIFPNLTNLTKTFLAATAAGWIALTIGLGLALVRGYHRADVTPRVRPWVRGLPLATGAAAVNAVAYGGLLLVWWTNALQTWGASATKLLYGCEAVAWFAIAGALATVYATAGAVPRGRRALLGIPMGAAGSALLASSALVLLTILERPQLFGTLISYVYAGEFLGWTALAAGAALVAMRTMEPSHGQLLGDPVLRVAPVRVS